MKSGSYNRFGNGMSPLMLVAIGCALVAIIMSVWAIRLHGSVGDLESELAHVRGQANASRYEFVPGELAPAGISGHAWISPTGSGVIAVSGLPKPGDNEVFQVWYETSASEPISGGTFTATPSNQGFMLIPADLDGLKRISISIEPEGGREAPEGPAILTVEIPGGKG